jgi:SAM-dependent methyltransferase
MEKAAKVLKKTSGMKFRMSMLLFGLSNPRFLKAVMKAFWHTSPFAAGTPRAAGTSLQKHDRSKQWALLQKLFYEVMSDLNTDRTMTFINLGYAGLETPQTASLSEANDSNQYATQLYDYLFQFCDPKGKDVLEVGCGRGGGAGFLFKTYHPKSYLGVDFAKANIEFCNRVHSEDGLRFEVGRAESLNVPDCSKDIIINVESSHCYTSPGSFFKEVHRILKPGGMFVFADIRGDGLAKSYQTVAMLEDQFKSLADMGLVDRTDITKNVMRALELAGDAQVKKWTHSMRATLRKNARSEWFIEEVFEPIARMSFSAQDPESSRSWYSLFKDGKAAYWSYVFRKNDSLAA